MAVDERWVNEVAVAGEVGVGFSVLCGQNLVLAKKFA